MYISNEMPKLVIATEDVNDANIWMEVLVRNFLKIYFYVNSNSARQTFAF